MAKVDFENVGKVYSDQTRAVDDFSLTIDEGEFMVLVGPSGCGKSTLMRILAGLEGCTFGNIRLDDQQVNNWSPQQRNIAMVFQNYALYPHMTVRDNIEFPLRMRKLPKDEINRRVDDAEALLDLGGLMDRKPSQLSGGQRQRVAMGRALVRDPSVFLMDEPLSNLDARLRTQIRTEISALQSRMKKTTLYVTHDQVEAMTLGDRVCVLNKGKLQQVATPMVLYERPANTFVASFLGSPGMNLLTAQCIDNTDKSKTTFRHGEHTITLHNHSHYPDQPLINQTYILGIRPEALSLEGQHSENDLRIQLKVDSLESLGHEHLIYGRLPDTRPDTDQHAADSEYTGGTDLQERKDSGRLAARLPATTDVLPGSHITLTAASGQVHLFDQGGNRIDRKTDQTSHV